MNNIKALRMQANLSQLELSRLCGVHQTAVSQWENGRTCPDMETLMMLSQIFNTSLDNILGLDSPDTPLLIPLKGYAEGGEISFVDEGDYCESVPFTPEYGRREDYFAIQIADDFLSPTFRSDDILIIRSNCEVENNDFAVYKENNKIISICRIKTVKNGFIFISENPEEESEFYTKDQIKRLGIRFIGKAVELRRALN